MKITSALVAAPLLVLIAGCGGNDSAICRSVGGGSSSVTATPTAGGTVSDAPLAFDGDLGSFAGYSPAAGNGNLTIRGTMQSGSVLSGGTVAGVLLTAPTTSQTFQVSISTFLNGALQDTGTAGTRAGSGSDNCMSGATCEFRDGLNYFGIPTSKTFDAIEATLMVSGTPGAVEVRELCSR